MRNSSLSIWVNVYPLHSACQKLRSSGRLDPANPRIYNDVYIALLARQIGATVVTTNISDFEKIHSGLIWERQNLWLDSGMKREPA